MEQYVTDSNNLVVALRPDSKRTVTGTPSANHRVGRKRRRLTESTSFSNAQDSGNEGIIYGDVCCDHPLNEGGPNNEYSSYTYQNAGITAARCENRVLPTTNQFSQCVGAAAEKKGNRVLIEPSLFVCLQPRVIVEDIFPNKELLRNLKSVGVALVGFTTLDFQRIKQEPKS